MVIFIKLEKSLAEALLSDQSPINRLFENRAVQLLPNNQYPYVQVTEHPDGINLEDWTVKVYTICGDLLGDISASFFAEPFDDLSGIDQIKWQIKNCAIDFGWQLIYLQITQTAGETFYSTPFQLTDYKSEFTTRFDYKGFANDPMLSVQLQTWFRQKLNKDELTVYYETSTKRTVTENLKSAKYQLWQTEDFNNNTFEDFCDMLNSKFLYCNLIRCNLFEAFSIPEVKQVENFASQSYKLSFDESDIYNPNPPVIPPTPPVPDTIDILVTGIKAGISAKYVFFQFAAPAGYNIINFGSSYADIDTGVIGFQEGLSEILEDGTANFYSNFLPYSTGDDLTLNFFGLRITNGVQQLKINGDDIDPQLFTNADLLARTPRTLTIPIIII